MIDAANGGTLMDKNHVATRQLISNMATNYQQFGTRVVALLQIKFMFLLLLITKG